MELQDWYWELKSLLAPETCLITHFDTEQERSPPKCTYSSTGCIQKLSFPRYAALNIEPPTPEDFCHENQLRGR